MYGAGITRQCESGLEPDDCHQGVTGVEKVRSHLQPSSLHNLGDVPRHCVVVTRGAICLVIGSIIGGWNVASFHCLQYSARPVPLLEGWTAEVCQHCLVVRTGLDELNGVPSSGNLYSGWYLQKSIDPNLLSPSQNSLLSTLEPCSEHGSVPCVLPRH